MIRLFILEDHPIIVEGLKQRFRYPGDNIQVAGWSNDPDDFVKTASGDSFDILILDLWFPGIDPVENLHMIRKRFPEKPVVVLTYERSLYWIKVMMEQGVKAYLMKDVNKREMKLTLEKVSRGKTVFPDLPLSKPPSIEQHEIILQEFWLTPSERAIVLQLANGELLKDIADKRCMTVSAVEKRLTKIRKKANVKTNPELIRVAMEKKLI